MSDLEKPDYFEEPETHIDKQKIMNELKQKIADEKTNDELREEIRRLQNPWIPVAKITDNHPKRDRAILLFDRYENVATGFLELGTDIFYADISGMKHSDITHFAEIPALPEPPQQEQQK